MDKTLSQWRFIVHKNWQIDGTEIYLFYYFNRDSYSCEIKNGTIQLTKTEPLTTHKPILTLSGETPDIEGLFKAIVEGLRAVGYTSEVDTSKVIAAQATADERKEQITWLREKIDEVFNRLTGSKQDG